MTPEAAHVDEGHNTLEFATRAKKVVNEVAAVETMTSAALLKRQANEIEKLKAQLCQDGSVLLIWHSIWTFCLTLNEHTYFPSSKLLHRVL